MGNLDLKHPYSSPLKVINVLGGDVMHILRKSDNSFAGFGEAYISTIESGAVKAWKKHKNMTMNLVVPFGKVRFVFYSENSSFHVEEIGLDHYHRLTVPPGIWFGFKGLAIERSIIVNISDVEHEPDEAEHLPLSALEYDWS